MKKYNFATESSEDPEEPPRGSSGSLSPQARRLLILGVVGIVFSGALYVYMTYFGQSPPAPRGPATLRERAVPPIPPPAGRPAPPPREAVKPQAQVVPKPAAPEKKPPDVVAKVQPPKQPPPPVEPKAEVPETPKPPAAAAAPEKPSLKVAKPKEEGVKRYSLQVASLVVEQNALTLKKRLEKLGYTPIIRKVATSISRHRVYAGEFDGRQEAEEAARRLNVDGFPSNIVEGEAGKYRLEVGSAVQLNDAIDLAHNLQKKNHTAKIVSEPTSTLVHQVSVGQYGSRTEAQEALEALKKHGFAPLVVRR